VEIYFEGKTEETDEKIDAANCIACGVAMRI